MKLVVGFLVVLTAITAPAVNDQGIHARDARRARTDRRSTVSHSPRRLYQVTRLQGRWDLVNRKSGVGVIRGMELFLDSDSAFVLVRDETPYSVVEGSLLVLTLAGWNRIEDDEEGIEPHEFDDGSYGVKIWLYRITSAPTDAEAV